MAILKPKSQSKSRTFSVRLPASLLLEIEAVKREADARGLVFDVVEIAERAFVSACKSARAELSGAAPASVEPQA